MSQGAALLLTIVLELMAAACWWRIHPAPQVALKRLMLVTVTVSLITHPFAWWANYTLVGVFTRWTRVGLIELGVVVVEGALFFYLVPMLARRAFPLAFLTNATSFGVGLIILAWLR